MRYLFLFIMLSGCADTTTRQLTPGSESQPAATPVIEHRVINGLTGAPMSGVSVSVVGTTQYALTGEAGRATLRRSAQHPWVRTERAGFGGNLTRMGTDSKIWPSVVSDADVQAYLSARSRPPLDHDALDDPDLTENARRRLAQVRGARVHPQDNTPIRQLKQGLQPPETIRIYRRGPENNSCEGRVDVIPLEDYVKGVVPHEWIPSWHDESLRAGSIAARGYAWGWILAGGKYDCADLDDTTRSQVYREDRTDRADAATDSTRGVGIIRDGMFVQSEYSAENGDPTEFGVEEPLCTGREVFGHGRGMCQWGTQRWASQREKTAEWMVEHYYPGATTSDGVGRGGPQIALRQRLARVEAVSCPNPGNMFDCADFVNQGWSAGLFDLFIGHSVALSVEVTNTGTADALGVEVGIEIPTPYLSLTARMASAEVSEDSTAHYSARWARIPAGSTEVITLTLLASEYSVPTGQPVGVHTWIREITDVYAKPDWSSPPTRNEGQTYNDGDLLTLSEFDIFDARQWTWRSGDADMLEGWYSDAEALFQATNDGLRLTDPPDRVLLDSPYLPETPDPVEVLAIDYQSQTPIRLWWRNEGQPFSGERTLVLNPGENIVDGRGLEDAVQLRLEFSAGALVRTLALLREGTVPADIAVPVQDTSEAAQDLGLDGRVSLPDQGPMGPASPRLPTRVHHVGGCLSNETRSPRGSLWLLLIAGLLVGRRRQTRSEERTCDRD